METTERQNYLALDNQLCFSLYSASLAITQLYRPLLAPLGLTFPQYLVLLILWEEDGVSLNHIAQRLGQQPGALTPVLKRMEEDGFLVRTRNKKDERQLEICLTERSLDIRANALEINECIVKECGMPRNQLMDLKDQIDQLKANLLANDT